MKKIECKPKKPQPKSCNPDDSHLEWKKCGPFVQNPRAILIHRPISVITFLTKGKVRHHHVDYWCGGGCNFRTNIFVSAPPAGYILCARCEAMAIANNEPCADHLAGKHVHLGGVGALATPFKTCCE